LDEHSTIERLRERIAALEEAASLGFLLSAIVHEVNNPMSVLLIGADTMRRKAGDPDALTRHLDVLEQQANKIIHINQQLQELSRRNLGVTVTLDACDVADRFAEAQHALDGPSGRPEIGVRTAPGPIAVNPEQLTLVLRYLDRALGALGATGPTRLTVDRRDVPLFDFGTARKSPTREYVVFELRRGEPYGEFTAFTDWLGDFFDKAPPDHAVEMMACWEVIRKLAGRLELRHDADGAEVAVMVPVPAGEVTPR
jgi:hypothetical protein